MEEEIKELKDRIEALENERDDYKYLSEKYFEALEEIKYYTQEAMK
jgi:predicted RNA-binding protein with EMAP domain